LKSFHTSINRERFIPCFSSKDLGASVAIPFNMLNDDLFLLLFYLGLMFEGSK
jgi:hypothetical protein